MVYKLKIEKLVTEVTEEMADKAAEITAGKVQERW